MLFRCLSSESAIHWINTDRFQLTFHYIQLWIYPNVIHFKQCIFLIVMNVVNVPICHCKDSQHSQHSDRFTTEYNGMLTEIYQYWSNGLKIHLSGTGIAFIRIQTHSMEFPVITQQLTDIWGIFSKYSLKL